MRVKVPEEWRGLVGSEYIDILDMGELKTDFTKEVMNIKTYSYEDNQKQEKKKKRG